VTVNVAPCAGAAVPTIMARVVASRANTATINPMRFLVVTIVIGNPFISASLDAVLPGTYT
jgi:hypothetical protein